jgi:hypothetical protein
MKILRTICAVVLVPTLFMASCTVLVFPSWKVAERWWIQPVDGETPKYFPILVCWPNGGGAIDFDVLLYGQLDEFAVSHSGYSFIVPQTNANRVNEILNEKLRGLILRKRIESNQSTNEMRRGGKPYAYVKIEEASGSSQLLRVEYPTIKDNRNVGWYRASKRKITPVKRMSYGPGFAFVAEIVALVANSLLWIAGWFIFRVKREIKRSSSEQCSPPNPALKADDGALDRNLARRLGGRGE